MLIGRNPYMRLTRDRMGHYREYTATELREIAVAAGYDVRSIATLNYFGLRKRLDTTIVDHLLWPNPDTALRNYRNTDANTAVRGA